MADLWIPRKENSSTPYFAFALANVAMEGAFYDMIYQASTAFVDATCGEEAHRGFAAVHGGRFRDSIAKTVESPL